MKDVFGMSLVVAACVSCVSSAYAQGSVNKLEEYNFRVEAGPLAKVVSELASQARASISIGSAGEGVKANAVTGVHSLADALKIALADTGWTVQASSDRTFRITREGRNVEVLDAVIITARRNDFVRTTSSLLSRTNTPLRQTPGTVDSVTEEVLQSQNAISVYEALRNIPGVLFNTNNGATNVIIGQETTGDATFTNGLQGSRIARNPPITDIESIEVLKGPAAILVGATIASGSINYVPKRATGKSQADLSLSLGSESERIFTADVGGAISKERGLFWRLAAQTQDADRLPNGNNNPKQRVVNPMFGYRGDDVSLDVTLQHYTKFTPALSSTSYDPTKNSFQDYKARLSSDAGDQVESTRLSYNLEIDLSWSDTQTLMLRNKGLYQEANNKSRQQLPLAYDYMGMGAMVGNLASLSRDKQISEYIDLYAKVSTGPIEHQLIAAVDLSEGDTNRASTTTLGFATDAKPLPLLAIPYASRGSLTRYRQHSLILQDQMTMGDWHALIGARQTSYKATPYSFNTTTGTWQAAKTGIADADKLLFNVGLVYDFSKAVSGYISHNNGFSVPDSALQTSAGMTLPPTIRKQTEAGVKAGLLDDRLVVNFSTYHYTTDNSVEADLTNPLFYRSGAGMKGRGHEISVAGSLTPTLKVLLGYVHSSSDKPNGTPITSSPENVANLWALKTFRLGAKEAINVGFGGNYNDGFNSQSFIDGKYHKIGQRYVSANGSLEYTNGRYAVNAFMSNIFDRRNYLPSTQIGQIQLDSPRALRVDFRAKF